MLFAQVEQHIGRQVKQLVTQRRARARWQDRRLWDRVQLDRISFMDKVALLAPRGQATYNRMDELYDIRCAIAHGNIAAVGPIFIPTIAMELRNLARLMRS
jgi:hypothetical protein